MNKEKIEPFDVWRMAFGDAPPEYYIEVLFRGLALYLFMLFIMRWLGKRMAGELTIVEMVLMVTLGASVAVAIQVPEGGVLLGFVVLSCAFLFERGISALTLKSRRFEEISQGKTDLLVKDGVLQLHVMKDTRITHEQLFASLRGEDVTHLGEVERVYLEPGGDFSVYKVTGDAPPGLPVYPIDDEEILSIREQSNELKACTNCGSTTAQNEDQPCRVCRATTWGSAVK
jgi:uncharacterized membrane protein YcaP (DUF421 family)